MTSPATILNVDDDPAGLYSKSRILRFLGHNVVEASTGFEAIAIADSTRPDVILLDVNLPDISGYEVCRRIKSEPRLASTAILLTSAVFTKSADRARGIEGGADGYLIAPIEPEVVRATLNNLIEVRSAERAVRAVSEQWATTFRAISDGIALLNLDGCVIRCNPSFERVLHLQTGASVGASIFTLLPELAPVFKEVLREFGNYPQQEFTLGDSTLAMSFDPVVEDKKPSGVICILSDVTHDRETTRELIEAKERALEANRTKDRFLATLSHELRTPLTPVLILCEELLSDTSLDSAVTEVLRMMLRNILIEVRLIDDLLDLSRIAKNKLSLKLAEISAHNVVRLATELIAAEIESKGISIDIDLTAASDVIYGDAARLQQVIWNLLRNAVKFTPGGGKITIRSINPNPETIEISVQDTGVGIEPESIQRIFNAFEQIESESNQFGGLGLGLSISSSLVQMQGGSIRAESEGLTRGSTFSVVLPLISFKDEWESRS